MKLLSCLSLLAIFLTPAWGQTDRVDLMADRPGHAVAKKGGSILQADQATLNPETGQLAMRGHVHVTLPARGSHGGPLWCWRAAHRSGHRSYRRSGNGKKRIARSVGILLWCPSTRN